MCCTYVTLSTISYILLKITKELHCFVAFFPDFCVFQALYNGLVRVNGKEDHELYLLQGISLLMSQSQSVVNINVHTQLVLILILHLWHLRFGHAPLDLIKKYESLRFLKNVVPHHCIVRPLAKQAKLSFHLSTTLSKSAFDLLQCHIWGSYRFPTFDGKKYFITVIDDYIRYTWVFFINSKSGDFLTRIQNMVFYYC